MTKRHIEWADRKMHVRTAVETMSESTAKGMEFLMANEHDGFGGVAPTVEFIRFIDTQWDVFNTQRKRDSLPNVFKSALNAKNKIEVFSFLDKLKAYILSLKVFDPAVGKKVRLVDSPWKTGYIGCVSNSIALKEMFTEYVEGNQLMDFLAPYRLSQDHIEMFFGKIRSMNGSNDNPTASQFISAFRKLMCTWDIDLSEYSNVRAIIDSNVLTIPSYPRKSKYDIETSMRIFESAAAQPDLAMHINPELREWQESYEWSQLSQNNHLIDTRIDFGIAFTANKIEQQLIHNKMIHCKDCLRVLMNSEKITDRCDNIVINRPCRSTYELCKFADMALEIYINKGERMKLRIYLDVMNNICCDDLFPNFYEPEHDIGHKRVLLKFIIDEYVNKKCAYVAKQLTLSLQKIYISHTYRKEIHFQNQ